MENAEDPKLFPILADLLKENNFDKVGEEDIQLACDGIFGPEEIEDKLKDLVDLGVIAE